MRSKITVTAFIALLAIFVYIGIFAPKDENSVKNENRALAEMPEFTSETVFGGSFSKDFEDYLADNVGFRGVFTNLAARVKAMRGVSSYGSLVSVNKDIGAGGDASKGYLLIQDDTIMEIYSKNDESREMYSAMLNGYAEEIPENVNVYSMLIPTQAEFKKPDAGDSQRETIDYIYENADERIKTVNVYDSLKENIDDYIYFRTDHHWTARGAYLGYKSFAEEAGLEPVALSALKKWKADGFLGYLYNQANTPSMSKYADTVEWFLNGENYEFTALGKDENGDMSEYKGKIYNIPPAGEKPAYSVYMGGDHTYLKVKTDVKNGKTVCVIKDSYGNAFLPFLTNNYETVIAVDPRSYEGDVSELVVQENADDLLILNYTFTTTFPDFIEKLNEIR